MNNFQASKNWFFVLFAASLLVSCDDQPADSTSSISPSESDPYTAISGLYSDTLPCADCEGILVHLTLFADSSYAIRERYLGKPVERGASNGRYGNYRFEENNTRIRLDRMFSEEKSFYRPVEKGLLSLDANGHTVASELDYTLDLLDKIVGKQGNSFVRHAENTAERTGVVFSRTLKNDLTIDEDFIQKSSEPEKALISYFITVHDAGCISPCALYDALGLNEAGARDLASKWIGHNTVASDALSAPGKSGQLMLLQVLATKDGFRCSSVVQSTQGSVRYNDTFALKENKLMWTNHTQGDVKMQVAEKNSKRGPEFQEGGKQVIDMKKAKEKPKGGTQKQ